MCGCGKRFTVDHALSCTKGGYIHRRHDELRNLIAKLLEEIAHDVSVEPQLAEVTGENFPRGSNITDEARLDIAA